MPPSALLEPPVQVCQVCQESPVCQECQVYLGQAIIGGLLFYNWGFGLWNDCAHTVSFLMGIGVIILQFVFCTWWMKHHKRGPFEQLWYSLTWIGKKN